MAADMTNLVLQALEGQLISFSNFLGDNSRLDVLLENITEILNNHLGPRDGHLLGVDAYSNTMTGTGSDDDAVRNIRTSTSRTDNLTEAIKEIKLQILAFGVFAKSCPRLSLFVQIIELIVSKMNNSSSRSSPRNDSEESPVDRDNPAKTAKNDGAAFNFNDNCINNNNAPSNSKRVKLLATEDRVGAGTLLEVDKNTSPQSSDPKTLGAGGPLQLSDEAKRGLSTLISQVNQEIETLISNNYYASSRSSSSLLPYAKIRFRRIRVGTLELSKLVPSNSRLDLEASAAYISDKGLLFSMHHSCQTSKLVRIVLPHNSIKSVFMRTGSSEVSLQFRTGTQIGSMIRDKLGMKLENRESKGWYDPEGGATEKIIWFIGKSLPTEQINFIKRIYHKKLTVVIPNNSPPS